MVIHSPGTISSVDTLIIRLVAIFICVTINTLLFSISTGVSVVTRTWIMFVIRHTHSLRDGIITVKSPGVLTKILFLLSAIVAAEAHCHPYRSP